MIDRAEDAPQFTPDSSISYPTAEYIAQGPQVKLDPSFAIQIVQVSQPVLCWLHILHHIKLYLDQQNRFNNQPTSPNVESWFCCCLDIRGTRVLDLEFTLAKQVLEQVRILGSWVHTHLPHQGILLQCILKVRTLDSL